VTGPSIEIEDLCVDLGGRRVVDSASFAVVPGEIVGLVGANGSGKTTLIRAALGLARAVSGNARIGGSLAGDLTAAERASRVGYLPQERIIGWNLPAWRVAALGAPLRPPAESRAEALIALDLAGVAHLADRRVLDLSGGERAKILLARLLATRAPFLIADEPIAGLDPAAQLDTMNVLRAHAVQGGSVLATLHDLGLTASYCDRVVVMATGRVIAVGPGDEVFTATVLDEGFGIKGEARSTLTRSTAAAPQRPSPPEPPAYRVS